MSKKRIQIVKDSTTQLRVIGVYLWSIWEVEKEKDGNFYIQLPLSKQLTLIKPDECRILT